MRSEFCNPACAGNRGNPGFRVWLSADNQSTRGHTACPLIRQADGRIWAVRTLGQAYDRPNGARHPPIEFQDIAASEQRIFPPAAWIIEEISVGGVPVGYDREFDDDNKAIGASAGRPRAQPLRTIRGFRENRPRRWGKGIPAVSGCSSRRPSETSEEFRVAMINQDWSCGVLAFAAHSPTSSSRAPGALLLITSVCRR